MTQNGYRQIVGSTSQNAARGKGGRGLKELQHNILNHFIDGQSAGKPENNELPRKENTKGVILKRKETRVAEDGGG